MDSEKKYSFEELVRIVARLRRECPWDSVQTHQSLNTCLVNETQEVLEGVSILEKEKDASNLCEELGDLLMLILLHSEIAREEGIFTLEDVITGIASKMRFRHPRIFTPEDKEAVSLTWEQLKEREHEFRKKGQDLQ